MSEYTPFSQLPFLHSLKSQLTEIKGLAEKLKEDLVEVKAGVKVEVDRIVKKGSDSRAE